MQAGRHVDSTSLKHGRGLLVSSGTVDMSSGISTKLRGSWGDQLEQGQLCLRSPASVKVSQVTYSIVQDASSQRTRVKALIPQMVIKSNGLIAVSFYIVRYTSLRTGGRTAGLPHQMLALTRVIALRGP